MNLLELIQEVCTRTGIVKPSFVIGNTDQQIAQLLALLKEQLSYICQRHTWQVLVQEAVFTTVDGDDQGLLTALAPNGFQYILNDTIVNRTQRLAVYGPISPPKWQMLKALPTSGPLYRYRIARNHLLFDPPAVAGHTCAFEYKSDRSITTADGATFKRYPTLDTDLCLFDDELVILALRWKWKSEKGLDYAEDFRSFEETLNNLKARTETPPTLALDAEFSRPTPGIFIPSGNWNL